MQTPRMSGQSKRKTVPAAEEESGSNQRAIATPVHKKYKVTDPAAFTDSHRRRCVLERLIALFGACIPRDLLVLIASYEIEQFLFAADNHGRMSIQIIAEASDAGGGGISDELIPVSVFDADRLFQPGTWSFSVLGYRRPAPTSAGTGTGGGNNKESDWFYDPMRFVIAMGGEDDDAVFVFSRSCDSTFDQSHQYRYRLVSSLSVCTGTCVSE